MHKNTLIVICLLLAWTPSLMASTASIYDIKDTKNSKLLFKFNKKDTKKENQNITEATFNYPDGKVAIIDIAKFKDGKLTEFNHEQKQINAKGSVVIKDDKVLFSYTIKGKTKTDDEKYTENFVISPTIVPFVKTNWSTLMSGKSVKMRLGVLDRLETVGFKVFKDKDTTYKGQPAVELTMKPSSFIIAALVDPLKMIFTKDGKKILLFKGRTAPKLENKGKFNDLDALTVYEY